MFLEQFCDYVLLKQETGMRMSMEIIKLRDEYIKLGQALKAAGLVESGAESKDVILDGFVRVNGDVEFQRGKKLRAGDIVSFNERQIKIEE